MLIFVPGHPVCPFDLDRISTSLNYFHTRGLQIALKISAEDGKTQIRVDYHNEIGNKERTYQALRACTLPGLYRFATRDQAHDLLVPG